MSFEIYPAMDFSALFFWKLNLATAIEVTQNFLLPNFRVYTMYNKVAGITWLVPEGAVKQNHEFPI
jgi:hypothetical protein